MKEKILTLVDGVAEYKTKKMDNDEGAYYVMKTTNGDTWSDSHKNKKLITALDTGDDLTLHLKNITWNTPDPVSADIELTFNYEQAFELYCLLDLLHRKDPHFTQPMHYTKSKS